MHTQGRASRDKARQGQTSARKAAQAETRPDKARQGQTRPDKAGQGQTRPDKAAQGQTRPRTPKHSTIFHTRKSVVSYVRHLLRGFCTGCDARPDKARQGQTRPDKAAQGQTRPRTPKHSTIFHTRKSVVSYVRHLLRGFCTGCDARPDKARQGQTRPDKARQGQTRPRKARQAGFFIRGSQ